MPAIRALANIFKYPAVIPHVYTGVESIYPLLARMTAAAAESPSKRPRRATAAACSSVDVSDTRVLSLIVVVFLLVYSRMADMDVSLDQYNEWLVKATNTVLKSPSAKDMTYEELAPAIEETMAMAKEEDWLQMQWFDSVKPLEDTDEMEGVEMASSRAINTTGHGLGLRSGSDYIGLATMMQDVTDYLGKRQQEDYANWKAKIMARVQETETA